MSSFNYGKVLIDEKTLNQRVGELGEKLSEAYKSSEKPPVLICILKGAAVFTADLMRAMSIDVEIDFLRAASYGSGTESSGVIKITKDIDVDIAGRDVIIVEDIIDTGNTLFELTKLLGKRNPKSMAIAVLLNKPSRRTADIEPDYECFNIEDRFVVGYGLDYDEKYRGIPYIACLD